MIKSLFSKLSWPVLISLFIVTFSFSQTSADIWVPLDGFDYENYYQLDYIESHGSEYIDLGINSNNGLSGFINFELTGSSGALVGTDIYTNNVRYRSYLNFMSSSSLRLGYSNTYAQISGSYNSRKTYTFNILSGNVLLTIDDDNKFTNTSSFSYSKNYNIYLFGYNNGSAANLVSGKLYSAYINEHGFVPAMRKSDNKVGLFDLANNLFVTSNSGSFTYGNIVSPQVFLVTSNPVNGYVEGTGSYLSGTTAMLLAVPDPGYVFVGWDNGSEYNPTLITVDSDIEINPIFQLASVTDQYTLTLTSNNNDYGSVVGSGSYAAGTSVEISAVPTDGYIFSHWSDNNTENPRNLVIDSDISLSAVFVSSQSPITTFTITTSSNPNNGGVVIGGGSFVAGNTIQLKAVPEIGYQFTQWSDGVTDNPRSVVVSKDSTFVAYFVMPTYFDFESFTDSGSTFNPINYTNENLLNWYIDMKSYNVIDYLTFYTKRIDFHYSSYPTIRVTGRYYDNTITGLDVCSSTSINTTVKQPTEVTTISPSVAGEFDLGFAKLQFGIDVSDVTEMRPTSITSTEYSTQACQIMSLEGNPLYDWRAYGYETKNVDFGIEDYEATVYVPGWEDIQFDMSELKYLLEGLYASFTNNLFIYYHNQVDFTLSSRTFDLPRYGHLKYKGLNKLVTYVFNNSNFYSRPLSESNVLFTDYYGNGSSNIYWYDTDIVKWTLQSGALVSDSTYIGFVPVLQESLEFFSIPLDRYNDQVGFKMDSLDVYAKQHESLGLFNQFGNFLNGWFNRFYDKMSGTISGSGGSGESDKVIINNQYDIDIDLSIHDLLHDINLNADGFNDLMNENSLSDDKKTSLQTLADGLITPVWRIWFDNGLGYFIIVPLVLMILGLVL